MNHAHDPSHMERIDELLIQGVDPAEVLRKAGLLDCQDCAIALADMAWSEDMLRRAGAEERAALEALESEAPAAPGRAEAALAAHIAGSAPSGAQGTSQPKPRRRPWVAGLLAAAALLLIWIRPWSPEPPTFDPHPMGDENGSANYPNGSWPPAWSDALPAGGWFEVRVHAEEAGLAGRILEESGPLQAQTWEPNSTEAWPDAIIWVLSTHTGDGQSTSGPPQFARR